jgi:hypothetical protein
VIEMGLGAVEPAFPGQSAGTDRNSRLDGVVACPERVLRRIEQRENALALIAVHQVPDHGSCRQRGQRERADDAP